MHTVGLLQTTAQIVSIISLPPEMGARFRFLGASRPSVPAAWLGSSQKRVKSNQILARPHKQTHTSEMHTDKTKTIHTRLHMHHLHTHAICKTKHLQHINNKTSTYKTSPTHKQQSTKEQKHHHTSNQHKRHQKQNRGTKNLVHNTQPGYGQKPCRTKAHR